MKLLSLQTLSEAFQIPIFGRGAFAVWSRNFLYFRRTIWISLFWVIIEPLVYLAAIGYGVGHFIPEMAGTSYLNFFTPGLILISGMFVAFFEGAYGSYTKLEKQKTYEGIILSPVSATEICIGEISWAASKGLLSSLAVIIVAASQGLVEWEAGLQVLGVAALNCWLFASLGLLLAAGAKSYDWFVYSQSGFIVPMSLFSGTYFPIDTFPSLAQKISLLLPLTHSVAAARMLYSASIKAEFFIHLAVLFAFCFVLTNLAVAKMQKRIFS